MSDVYEILRTTLSTSTANELYDVEFNRLDEKIKELEALQNKLDAAYNEGQQLRINARQAALQNQCMECG